MVPLTILALGLGAGALLGADDRLLVDLTAPSSDVNYYIGEMNFFLDSGVVEYAELVAARCMVVNNFSPAVWGAVRQAMYAKTGRLPNETFDRELVKSEVETAVKSLRAAKAGGASTRSMATPSNSAARRVSLVSNTARAARVARPAAAKAR
jgi:hypothetical protein